MLPKEFRLRKDKDIEKVIKKSKRLVTKNFKVYVHLRENGKKLYSPRFAFIVPKKLAKSAVKRNRARRKVVGILSKYLSGYFGKSKQNLIISDLAGKDIILYFRSLLTENGKGVVQHELKNEIQELLDFATQVK